MHGFLMRVEGCREDVTRAVVLLHHLNPTFACFGISEAGCPFIRIATPGNCIENGTFDAEAVTQDAAGVFAAVSLARLEVISD